MERPAVTILFVAAGRFLREGGIDGFFTCQIFYTNTFYKGRNSLN